MRNATVREKKVEEFIAHVKEEYQLPITRPGRKSKDSKEEKEMVEEGDEEFKEADYIPEIFNRSE